MLQYKMRQRMEELAASQRSLEWSALVLFSARSSYSSLCQRCCRWINIFIGSWKLLAGGIMLVLSVPSRNVGIPAIYNSRVWNNSSSFILPMIYMSVASEYLESFTMYNTVYFLLKQHLSGLFSGLVDESSPFGLGSKYPKPWDNKRQRSAEF